MVDVVWPGFRDDPSVVPPQAQEYVSKAAQFFNIPELQVVLLLNYHKEPTKSFALDKLIFSVLSRAVSTASGPVILSALSHLFYS